MPCYAAMTDKFVSVPETQAVEDVLDLMQKEGTEIAVLTSEEGAFVGLFSYRILMRNLLPVSVSMADGLQLDMQIRAAPGIAKRLKKAMPLSVSEFMERQCSYVHPDTPVWEGINLLVQHGAPVLVIDEQTEKVVGIIDGASAFQELNRMQEG